MTIDQRTSARLLEIIERFAEDMAEALRAHPQAEAPGPDTADETDARIRACELTLCDIRSHLGMMTFDGDSQRWVAGTKTPEADVWTWERCVAEPRTGFVLLFEPKSKPGTVLDLWYRTDCREQAEWASVAEQQGIATRDPLNHWHPSPRYTVEQIAESPGGVPGAAVRAALKDGTGHRVLTWEEWKGVPKAWPWLVNDPNTVVLLSFPFDGETVYVEVTRRAEPTREDIDHSAMDAGVGPHSACVDCRDRPDDSLCDRHCSAGELRKRYPDASTVRYANETSPHFSVAGRTVYEHADNTWHDSPEPTGTTDDRWTDAEKLDHVRAALRGEPYDEDGWSEAATVGAFVGYVRGRYSLADLEDALESAGLPPVTLPGSVEPEPRDEDHPIDVQRPEPLTSRAEQAQARQRRRTLGEEWRHNNPDLPRPEPGALHAEAEDAIAEAVYQWKSEAFATYQGGYTGKDQTLQLSAFQHGMGTVFSVVLDRLVTGGWRPPAPDSSDPPGDDEDTFTPLSDDELQALRRSYDNPHYGPMTRALYELYMLRLNARVVPESPDLLAALEPVFTKVDGLARALDLAGGARGHDHVEDEARVNSIVQGAIEEVSAYLRTALPEALRGWRGPADDLYPTEQRIAETARKEYLDARPREAFAHGMRVGKHAVLDWKTEDVAPAPSGGFSGGPNPDGKLLDEDVAGERQPSRGLPWGIVKLVLRGSEDERSEQAQVVVDALTEHGWLNRAADVDGVIEEREDVPPAAGTPFRGWLEGRIAKAFDDSEAPPDVTTEEFELGRAAGLKSALREYDRTHAPAIDVDALLGKVMPTSGRLDELAVTACDNYHADSYAAARYAAARGAIEVRDGLRIRLDALNPATQDTDGGEG